MTYQNKFDKSGECAAQGEGAEELFSQLSTKRNYKVRKADRKQNIYDHIDFYLTGVNKESNKDQTITVDVKAQKKTSRKDSSFNDSWVWVEIKNVQGRDGWLYGKANFIAFEQKDYFLLVPRKTLIEVVLSNVRFDLDYVQRASQAKYRIYQRPGRRDQITQIKVQDLLELKNSTKWKK